MNLALISMDVLWRNALAAIPLAIIVGLACRYLPCRAATRHALWLIVLLSLAFPPLAVSNDLTGYMSRTFASLLPPEQPAPPVSKPPSGLPQRPARADLLPIPVAPSDLWHQLARSNAPNALLRDFVASNDREIGTEPLDSLVGPSPVENAVVSSNAAQSAANLTGTLQDQSPGLRRSAAKVQSPPIHVADSSSLLKSDEFTAISLTAIEWQQWLAGVISMRDAIVRLTPIPTTLWWGGCLVIALVLLIRTLRFRRIMNEAVAAPSHIRCEVNRAAAKIGLTSTPATFISHTRISPMIWCGFRRALLLPQSLWDELDSTGRDAVLLHELAHLRRRDHWVRWIELIIGCVYWWHPVVWLVRKRLRDEADFCCDAWVTALLPTSRGAYARALVATRQYISESRDATPAVGLGITTNRTKRFARRLTMVMTNRSGPRLSAIGAGMTMCLALTAWLAAPLWACPPDEKKETCTTTAPAKAKVSVGAGARVRVAPAENLDATTFERHMAEREAAIARAGQPALAPHGQQPRVRALAVPAPSGGGGDVNERLNRLEERLNRLTEHLEHLIHQQHGAAAGGQLRRIQPTPPAPPAPPVPPAPPAPPVPGQPGAFGGGMHGGVAGAPGARLELRAQQDDGELITKVYRLPQGKCAALYELMARSDVPVRVGNAGNEGISVEATAHQHELFGGFVALIHPEGGHQHAQAHARQMLTLERALAGQQALRAGDLARAKIQLETQLNARGQYVDSLRKSMGNQKADLQRQIEQLHRRAEELNRKARELEEKAGKVQSEADEVDDDGRKQALEAQALALESQAEQFEAQAEQQEDQAEQLEEIIESLEEELTEALASMEDEFASLAEELQLELENVEVEAALAAEEAVAEAQAAAEEAAAEVVEEVEPENDEK